MEEAELVEATVVAEGAMAEEAVTLIATIIMSQSTSTMWSSGQALRTSFQQWNAAIEGKKWSNEDTVEYPVHATKGKEAVQ